MSEELEKTFADCLPSVPRNGASIQQNAAKLYNIKNVENAGGIFSEVTINIFGNGFPGMPGYTPAYQQRINTTRYHLFVCGGESFSCGFFEVDKKRALVEKSTCEAFQAQYVKMTDEVITELKSYPALFMDEVSKENLEKEMYVYWGIITDIKRKTSSIQIFFRILDAIPVQQIIDIRSDLDIMGTPFYGEMNHSHWALKDINIIDVLSRAGISVMAPTI